MKGCNKMNVLFVNACVREESRTKVLADAVLKKLGGTVTEVNLNDSDLQPLNREHLNYRSERAGRRDYSDPMFDHAKAFAAADVIVVAAPYWDLSYPAVLKIYIEQVMVDGLTFLFSEQGIPTGLCKAQKLIYVSTAGGKVYGGNMGYDNVKVLAEAFWGIKETMLFQTEDLDVWGVDIKAQLDKTVAEIEQSNL
ncbi:MAG: NAD(P)H-dependent oxidoreductase [Firmicutes bacterium]|nr:NAD(P)H-dependent oxidoreductase [Bacillota bacterium]